MDKTYKEDVGNVAHHVEVNVQKLAFDNEEMFKKAVQDIEAAQKAKKVKKESEEGIVWQENGDSLDAGLLEKSEGAYIDIAKEIVKASARQLSEQNKSKNLLKKIFTIFFIVLLSAQYAVLACLLIIRAFQTVSYLSDTVIIAYISSVFLESLGAVIIMIRYAFASEQETKVLEILNSIITRFQKFPK